MPPKDARIKYENLAYKFLIKSQIFELGGKKIWKIMLSSGKILASPVTMVFLFVKTLK